MQESSKPSQAAQRQKSNSEQVQRQEFASLDLAWQSEHQLKAPTYFIYADDTLNAQAALKWVRQGVAIVWQGDYHQAKQLLAAMARQIDKSKKRKASPESANERFNLYRLAQAQKAQLLNSLLLRIHYSTTEGFQIMARRAPDIQEAAQAAWKSGDTSINHDINQEAGQAVTQVVGQEGSDFIVSLRELLGVIGAWEWRKKGLWIEALQAKIYPFYGVFAPVRGEYLDLMMHPPLPSPCKLGVDIGSGTGVLSAILARRGVERVIATDTSAHAVACTKFNLEQLSLSAQVEVREQSLFPDEQADLIVCNPPWLPSKSASSLEAAVYDPHSRMLKGFLQGARQHLSAHGQAWLIISDLAEHLGLRSREELLQWIEEAGLQVLERYDTRPKHAKAFKQEDPLYHARSAEVTSLWVLDRREAG
ncbi:MAG: class I SAM-dependent methyltransferase [Pelistega sp.]|nr:class I SAM-dependent methyltransferase [Pelistega sp.]